MAGKYLALGGCEMAQWASGGRGGGLSGGPLFLLTDVAPKRPPDGRTKANPRDREKPPIPDDRRQPPGQREEPRGQKQPFAGC